MRVRVGAEVVGRQLDGWIVWSDPLFRPTIGIFQDDRLVRVLSTRQIWVDDGKYKAGYICRFHCDDLPLSDSPNDQEVSVTCLELGAVLHTCSTRSEVTKSRHRSIDSIRRSAHPDLALPLSSGFQAFLRLPILDQVHILYMDILGRGADAGAIASRVERLTSGRDTILDVRDQILHSDEFRSKVSVSREQRIGFWCLWDGLSSLGGLLQRPNGDLTATKFSPPASSTQREKLYKIALGSRAELAEGEDWLRRNIGFVSSIDIPDRLPIGTTTQFGAPVVKGRPVRRSLLSSMRVGDCGFRAKGSERIKGRAGSSGHVAFGPYVQLRPGTYRVEVRLNLTEVEARDKTAILVEFLSGNLLVALQQISTAEPGEHIARLDFSIPEEHRALLAGAKYEARITTDGRNIFEICSVTIEELPENDTTSYPPSANLLPLLKASELASVDDDHVATRIPSAGGGHVLFGPYIALLPGRYHLSANFLCDSAIGDLDTISWEVHSPDRGRIAFAVFQLLEGEFRTVLDFCIPDAHDMANLTGPIEFRLSHSGASIFNVTDVRVFADQSIFIDDLIRAPVVEVLEAEVAPAVAQDDVSNIASKGAWPWSRR